MGEKRVNRETRIILTPLGPRLALGLCCAAVAAIWAVPVAQAASVVLKHNGSEARFNLDGAPDDAGAAPGLYMLKRPQLIAGDPAPPPLHDVGPNGINYFFRIGSAGPEAPVTSLPNTPIPFDTNADGDNDTLLTLYSGPAGLNIQVMDSLTGFGPGSHKTNLSRTVTLQNTSGAPMDVHWFAYYDLSLTNGFNDLGAPTDDSLYPDYGQIFTGGTTQVQMFDQDNGANGPLDLSTLNSESITFATLNPTHFEIGPVNGSTDAFARLNDGAATTLTDVANNGLGGPIRSADTTSELAFAFQWDLQLPANGGSVVITENTFILPEPSAVALLLAGLGGLGLRRPTRRSRRARS
jgi:hypothetical protein